MNSIIANGNTTSPTIVTIARTDAGFQSQSCGTWTQLAATESEGDTSEEQAPEDVLAAQYEYINSGDYANAYALFAQQSKQIVSLEQYGAFFEANAPYVITDYSFPSVRVQGEAATVEVAFTASSAGGVGQFYKTQQLVQEAGGWRVVMRDDQVAAFLGTG